LGWDSDEGANLGTQSFFGGAAAPCRLDLRAGVAGAALLSSLFLAVTPASSWAQNLIQNPSFEEGEYPIPDWSQTGSSGSIRSLAGFGIPAYSGNYDANPFATGGTLSQTVISQSGRYDFSFYYAVRSGQTWSLTTTVGTMTVFSNSALTNSSYFPSNSILKLPTERLQRPLNKRYGLDSLAAPSEIALAGVPHLSAKIRCN
jgi:hypothetical protein